MTSWKSGDRLKAREWHDKAIQEIDSKHINDDETRLFREEAEALLSAPDKT